MIQTPCPENPEACSAWWLSLSETMMHSAVPLLFAALDFRVSQRKDEEKHGKTTIAGHSPIGEPPKTLAKRIAP